MQPRRCPRIAGSALDRPAAPHATPRSAPEEADAWVCIGIGNEFATGGGQEKVFSSDFQRTGCERQKLNKWMKGPGMSGAVSSLHRAVACQSDTHNAYFAWMLFFARSRGGRRILKPLFDAFCFTAESPVCACWKTQIVCFFLSCTAMSSIEPHNEKERHRQNDSHRHREPISQTLLF